MPNTKAYAKKYQIKWRAKNRLKTNALNKSWRLRHLKHVILSDAKKRASKDWLAFDLTLSDLEDIPDRCPALGIPIVCGASARNDNSPSLDRVDNSKGYVRGNVRFISWRANSIKRDANSAELRLIADYMDRHEQDSW